MKLIKIPKELYQQYRTDVIFDCYKWDPQFLDSNTVADQILVLDRCEHVELERLALGLYNETIAIEQYLVDNIGLAKKLNLGLDINQSLKYVSNFDLSKATRLMRFDFHPIKCGNWAISEVNSDVPGGYAESSFMPKLALNIVNSMQDYSDSQFFCIDFLDKLTTCISSKIPKGGTIMLIHCTIFADDRQVMQALGDRLQALGYTTIYGSDQNIKIVNSKVFCTLDGCIGEVDFVVRFIPLEWLNLQNLEQNLFRCTTPQCNYPISIISQTKRLPLIFDQLIANGLDLTHWKALLPHTTTVRYLRKNPQYIVKPVFGRVGENIGIKEACTNKEYNKILRQSKLHPKKYIVQKKFESLPIATQDGRYLHICIGVYIIDGLFAGYYARASEKPRIDSRSADLPVLIAE
ncbi:MAG: glutathionylspermidine synthase family protein [Firmicutes bacterium]|nr:glutathionylspermidine synthase family protein [Bacillota bacterium]MCL1953903.1 glutathionylspermidine synthase family protein [Bacillota bacterium]